MYTDIAKFLNASPEWVVNWLDTLACPSVVERQDTHWSNIFLVHEIARNIMYHLDQLAENDYWKAVDEYKHANTLYFQAVRIYQGRNPTLTNELYKQSSDLSDKKRKAFAYQVEIEKILLQGGFAHKQEEKDRIIYHIKMLADGFDPNDIPTSIEEADSTSWQSEYWDDEDSDNMSNYYDYIEEVDLSEAEWF